MLIHSTPYILCRKLSALKISVTSLSLFTLETLL